MLFLYTYVYPSKIQSRDDSAKSREPVQYICSQYRRYLLATIIACVNK